MMLDMGLRIAEALPLKVSDIQDGWLAIKRKGGNIQHLPVPGHIMVLIKYLNLQPEDRLVNMSRSTLQHYVPVLSMEIIGKRISCHSLRHSFATNAMRKGLNVNVLKEFLGHANLVATSRYCHVVPQDLQEFIDQASSPKPGQTPCCGVEAPSESLTK
jgi:integrase/recombinase XerD